MDKIRSWVNFEEGTSQDELQEGLKGLTVASLKILCKEKVKSSGTKAELIGRLVSDWSLKFDFGEGSMDDPSTSLSIARIPVFADIHSWSKDASFISTFTFMDLYEYLIHSAEKEFNRESMKAFKSLKAYKYFEDHLVRNVWVHNEGTMAVIRCH